MSIYPDNPCLEVVRPIGRFKTYCGNEKGHSGPHIEIPVSTKEDS